MATKKFEVLCGGRRMRFASRAAAEKKFFEAMLSCEGSEADRYKNIYLGCNCGDALPTDGIPEIKPFPKAAKEVNPRKRAALQHERAQLSKQIDEEIAKYEATEKMVWEKYLTPLLKRRETLCDRKREIERELRFLAD